MKYATGKNALGVCDRCGFKAPLNILVPDGEVPGLLVHPTCRDEKHPTRKPFNTDEGIALKNPRPDRDDDTVDDVEDITGTATAGGANTIDLASDASAIPGAYVNCTITLTGGTGSGQEKTIQAYNGSTKRATVLGNWSTQPDATTTYSIEVGLLAARLGFSNHFGGNT